MPKKLPAKKPAKNSARGTIPKNSPKGKTTSARKVASPVPTSDDVRVRMFRQGLGDCFLIQFPKTGGDSYSILIDCGVLVGTDQGAETMVEVAKKVEELTGGNLDLLIVTHEHWDHLSGFLQAKKVFEGIKVHQIWMAWTESETDPQAIDVRKKRALRLKALTAAVNRMQKEASPAMRSVSQDIRNLLGFFGAASRGTTAEALEAVRSFGERKPEYLRPDDPPRTIAGVPGVRIYVLGPPFDRKLLFKSDPTKSHSEVYSEFAAAAMDAGAEASFATAVEPGEKLFDPHAPFGTSPAVCRRTTGKTPVDDLDGMWTQLDRTDEDARACGERIERIVGRYSHPEEAWRRIDDDWFGTAAQIALKLDSDTNNTSLVLAIELVESGRVLLFPGDAQVGNWLSWHQLDGWDLSDPRVGQRKVTVKDLLHRTVLYKVGHHGSHNATLRDLGLEMMTSPELTALIPVDEKKALSKRPHPWKMPFGPLYEALISRTQGRILRSDQSLAKTAKPVETSTRTWQEFVDSVTEDPLSFEIRIPLT